MKIRIPARIDAISEAIEKLGEELKKIKKLSSKKLSMTLMTTEDLIAEMIANSSEDSFITLSTSGFMGVTKIKIAYVGQQMDVLPMELGVDLSMEDMDEETEYLAIKNILKKALKEDISYKYTNGVGVVEFTVYTSEFSQLYFTLACIALGIVAGIILKYIPASVKDMVIPNVLKPAYTMFLNAIKMVVGPLVLFSIAASVAGFDDIKSLGRIGLKVFLFYCATSLVALFIGLGVYTACPLGNPELVSAMTEVDASTLEKASAVSVSIKDTIVGIVPSNIVTALNNSDMLQIIFFAILLGIACTMLGAAREGTQNALATINEIFSKITTIIVKFMPLAVFCSMATLVATIKLQTLLSLIGWVALIYVADLLMIVFYGLIMAVLGRLDPFIFYKKVFPLMVNGYSFASSNAVLPISMDIADKKLGINKKLFSFSLPLGSTINMDGNCVTLIITVLFMAKVFGIHVETGMLVNLFITIMALSIGAPGVPGGNLICITMLLPQYNIPVEAVSLIVGLYSFIGSMQVVVNSTGDSAITTIIAAWEKMIDKTVFHNNN